MFLSIFAFTNRYCMNTTKKNELTIEAVVVAAVIVLSLINVTNYLSDLFSLSVGVSVLGVVGGVLFFLKNSWSAKLIYLWIILQIVSVRPFFDVIQVYSLGFSFTGDDTELYINIVAILYLVFYKFILSALLTGKQLTFNEFRESDLGDIFPLRGTVESRAKVGDENNWLLVNLEVPFEYDGSTISNVLIKRKDDKSIKVKANNQIIYFRLVRNEADLADTSDTSKFPFIEWVLCK